VTNDYAGDDEPFRQSRAHGTGARDDDGVQREKQAGAIFKLAPGTSADPFSFHCPFTGAEQISSQVFDAARSSSSVSSVVSPKTGSRGCSDSIPSFFSSLFTIPLFGRKPKLVDIGDVRSKYRFVSWWVCLWMVDTDPAIEHSVFYGTRQPKTSNDHSTVWRAWRCSCHIRGAMIACYDSSYSFAKLADPTNP
jgi:hypothetical protein